jgi:hypothetical protein
MSYASIVVRIADFMTAGHQSGWALWRSATMPVISGGYTEMTLNREDAAMIFSPGRLVSAGPRLSWLMICVQRSGGVE